MSHSKQHLLILSSEFPPLPGGIGNHAHNIAEHLQASGYQVSVIVDQRDSIENESKFDSKLKSRVYRIRLRKFRILMYLKRIGLALKLARKNDVLICSGKFSLWLGAFLGFFIKIETIAIIHGSEVNFSNKKLKYTIDFALKKFDKIIAVSQYTKHLVSPLKLNNISVIPNGFSPGTWNTKEASELQLAGFPKLLTVGNVTERKGQANVIAHLPELLKTFPDVHYHCVGFKTEVNNCLKLAKTLNVLPHVTFHGHVSHEELKAFYKKSDICVMLSHETKTGDVEGFGIALLEANYFGVPTIGALDCGIEDAINDNVSGLLIEAKHTEAFVDAIKTIESQKDSYKKGAEDWAKKHQWITIIKTYIDTINA